MRALTDSFYNCTLLNRKQKNLSSCDSNSSDGNQSSEEMPPPKLGQRSKKLPKNTSQGIKEAPPPPVPQFLANMAAANKQSKSRNLDGLTAPMSIVQRYPLQASHTPQSNIPLNANVPLQFINGSPVDSGNETTPDGLLDCTGKTKEIRLIDAVERHVLIVRLEAV